MGAHGDDDLARRFDEVFDRHLDDMTTGVVQLALTLSPGAATTSR